MNSQNILKFWGTKLDLKLDSSEFHDYEVHKTELDYNDEVLDINTPITYPTLVISTTGLTNADCERDTISLIEYDNRINNSKYVYSGYTWTIPYSAFTLQLNNSDLILENDVYGFFDVNNNLHYLVINGYNDPVYNPYSLNLSGFMMGTTGVTGTTEYCINRLSGETITGNSVCCPLDSISSTKPWAYQINHGNETDNCEYGISRRTEKGWTLDFIFNKENLPWSDGNAFYYWGVRGETDVEKYADNNLSFSFTDDGRIQWQSYRYSGVCLDDGTFDESYYISSGQTPVLCPSGTSNNFNVTIVFNRYKYYTDCNLDNDGGWNDLVTGRTLDITFKQWLTGDTPTYTDTEFLNKKWADEKNRRLGILKIYLNGRPIYKLKDWEEIIPSSRGEQPFIQSWGKGTEYSGNIHNMGTSCFNFKRVKYFEEPLDFVHVRHHYLSESKPNYDIVECNEDCLDSMSGITSTLPPTPTMTRTPTPTPSQTPTPTPTPVIVVSPTPTPTPSSTPSPIYYAYLFIEPLTGVTSLATYMAGEGHSWGGFNMGVPTLSQTTFNNELNSYMKYVGWINGEFPAIREQIIPRTSGGIDEYGNPISIYNFTTHEILANTIECDSWYTWIIPNDGINNLKQTQIGFNFLNGPNDLITTFMNSTIYNFTVNYTGYAIPAGNYRIYTTKPSTIFRTNNNDNIYFKGIQIG
jgi:hypothetical protein